MTQKRRNLVAELIQRAQGKFKVEAANHQIPTYIYYDETHFQREFEQIFLHKPLILCPVAQLPEPGDALVQDWLGVPMVTVRNQHGEVATFLNVCRHRNMRLVAEQGNTQLKSFVCPYHQWTYGLDGKLKHIPLQESFADLDLEQLGLISLPTEERHGFIWVQATAHHPMQLDSFLSGIGEDLDAFQLPESKLYKQHNRLINCNWKLVQEAFLDGYHVVRLHKNSIAEFFMDAVATTEMEGVHIRSAVGRKSIADIFNLEPEQWDLRQHCTFSYTLFPNSIVVVHPDYISHMALFPQSATQTLFHHSMFVTELPNTEKGKQHFDKSFELIDQGVFQKEDIFVCEGAQLGMQSGANTHLLLGGHEVALNNFHQVLEQQLLGEG